MIKHIIKLLWNRKRQYYGVFIEQLLVTIILSVSAVVITEAVKKYKTPGMLNVENTFTVGYMGGDKATSEDITNAAQSMDVIVENLRKLPYVKTVSKGLNLTPYLKNDKHYTQYSDSVHIDGKHFKTVMKYSDEYGATVYNIDMQEGVWLENRALPDGSTPAVITRQFADKAGWTTSVGKKLTLNGKPHTVVGVAAGLKQEPFLPSPIAMVTPVSLLAGYDGFSENAAKIKAGMEKEFTEAFRREFKRMMSGENIEIMMVDLQSNQGYFMFTTLLNILLLGIPTLFLFIFAFIGTFGLYWMISRKRMKEYALRIALGSTKNQLTGIVVSESLILTGIAIIPTLALSFFLYEFDAVHIIAVGATIATMLVFAVISAWYPAWMVSKVNPSESLKYE